MTRIDYLRWFITIIFHHCMTSLDKFRVNSNLPEIAINLITYYIMVDYIPYIFSQQITYLDGRVKNKLKFLVFKENGNKNFLLSFPNTNFSFPVTIEFIRLFSKSIIQENDKLIIRQIPEEEFSLTYSDINLEKNMLEFSNFSWIPNKKSYIPKKILIQTLYLFPGNFGNNRSSEVYFTEILDYMGRISPEAELLITKVEFCGILCICCGISNNILGKRYHNLIIRNGNDVRKIVYECGMLYSNLYKTM